MIKVNPFDFGEHPPIEFLLALAYEYETEMYDLNLVRQVDFQITQSRDGRVEVRHPYINGMSNKHASEVRFKLLRYADELCGNRITFFRYVKELGRINFREVTYMYLEEFKSDLDKLRKEIEIIDKRKFERSSNSKRMHFGAISENQR